MSLDIVVLSVSVSVSGDGPKQRVEDFNLGLTDDKRSNTAQKLEGHCSAVQCSAEQAHQGPTK